MTDQKRMFLDIARVYLMEFAVNHPGKSEAANFMEHMYDLTEDQINAAYEQHGAFAPAIAEYTKYLFTNGRNGFKRPSWL